MERALHESYWVIVLRVPVSFKIPPQYELLTYNALK